MQTGGCYESRNLNNAFCEYHLNCHLYPVLKLTCVLCKYVCTVMGIIHVREHTDNRQTRKN